jgi:hypothetical protein
MVEITLPIVLQIVQTVSIAVGIFYYLFNMRNAQKTRELTLKAQEQAIETRQAQLFYGIYNRMSQADFVEASTAFYSWEYSTLDEFRKIRAVEQNNRYFGILSTHFEGVGVLVRLGLIPIQYVAHIHPALTRMFWEKHGPIIREARKYWSDPNRHTEVEYLYNELMKYLEEHPEIPT